MSGLGRAGGFPHHQRVVAQYARACAISRAKRSSTIFSPAALRARDEAGRRTSRTDGDPPQDRAGYLARRAGCHGRDGSEARHRCAQRSRTPRSRDPAACRRRRSPRRPAGSRASPSSCRRRSSWPKPSCGPGTRIPLIGVGGIDSAVTAWAKIRAGASLLQLYSALVYKGPGLIGGIKTDFSRRCGRPASLRSRMPSVGTQPQSPRENSEVQLWNAFRVRSLDSKACPRPRTARNIRKAIHRPVFPIP